MMSEHKIKFTGARVCFIGFSDEEKEHMSQVLFTNHGVLSNTEDPYCTHVVVDDTFMLHLPDDPPPKAKIVKAEWFWASVQNELCVDEADYMFEDYLESITSPVSKLAHNTSASSRARKRKRIQQLTPRDDESPFANGNNKRRSSISDAGLLSVSGSFLDCTVTPDKNLDVEGNKKLSKRQQVVMELVQTESNYVGILETILKAFKLELEEMPESEAILNPAEIKLIFGNLPSIHTVHSNMLQDLKQLLGCWSNEASVGEVFIKYAPELTKSYPPFINHFETSKETLEACDAEKPRFHAFLKRKQAKPECGRQSLKELLIRPVQRLPSIILLLNDILKQTDKTSPDHSALEQAVNCIKEAMTHINEDKRKAEAQHALFELFSDIENCPPHLISSHRCLVARCDCVETTELLSPKRGDILAFLLFTDTLEICKKRARNYNQTKKHSVRSNGSNKMKRQYKHVEHVSLSNIRRVINVQNTEDTFSLASRSSDTVEETIYTFRLADDTDKLNFLKILCTQISLTVCTPDPDEFYDVTESSEVNTTINTSTVMRSTSSLSRALKFASKTSLKVCRSLNLNKNTSSRPLILQGSVTPNANQLAQMRLHSCNNLNDLNSPPATPIPPRSVQPTRRIFSVSSLRIL